jgi:hypothetical protein
VQADARPRSLTPGFLLDRGRYTTAIGINNRGQITGRTGAATAPVGFLLDRGRFTTFTVPAPRSPSP